MTGTRQREMAAWQEASGTEPEELTYRLSQRRQRNGWDESRTPQHTCPGSYR